MTVRRVGLGPGPFCALPQTMNGPYGDLLDDPAVCSNCLRRIRVERQQTKSSSRRSDVSVELSATTRDPVKTTLEWAPHRPPTQSKGCFCACGSESAFDRVWDPQDIDREPFRRLLKQAIVTLEQRGTTLQRKETLMYALSHFDSHGDADRALANAIDAGIVAAAAAPNRDGSDDQLRADGGR